MKKKKDKTNAALFWSKGSVSERKPSVPFKLKVKLYSEIRQASDAGASYRTGFKPSWQRLHSLIILP